MTSDLIAAFSQYFELVHANTDEMREHVYALRYQVYVLETGFERAEDCFDGKERDAYDPRSDHYLIRHRRSGLFAATARLILSDPEAPEADYPIEHHCEFFEGAGISDPRIRRRLAEISRFAVSKAFKRRVGEAGTLAGVSENIDMYFEEDERRILPHLSLGLFAAVMRMVHTHQVTHCYAVMEPALHRLIGRFGVIFNPIGPSVDYHGLRIPCLGTVDEALPSIKRVAPSVWDLITERGALVQDMD
jgi:N-acyl amino acid synthase of PEP-CTERM/exosortase system